MHLQFTQRLITGVDVPISLQGAEPAIGIFVGRRGADGIQLRNGGGIQLELGRRQIVFGHSHPTRGGESQQAIDRYPSPDDWAALARVAGQAGAAANPSLWITGPDKVTREFSLSERAYFESLATPTDTSRLVAGEGLDGKERTQSCG